MSDFVSCPLFGFTLVIRNTFIFFDKKYDVRFEDVLSKCV